MLTAGNRTLDPLVNFILRHPYQKYTGLFPLTTMLPITNMILMFISKIDIEPYKVGTVYVIYNLNGLKSLTEKIMVKKEISLQK